VTGDRWYLTDSAVNCYVFARRWTDSAESLLRAEAELLRLMPDAAFRARDTYGRELWRSPKNTGGGLRWVVDPRPHPHPTDRRPRVLWVGQARPHAGVWSGP